MVAIAETGLRRGTTQNEIGQPVREQLAFIRSRRGKTGDVPRAEGGFNAGLPRTRNVVAAGFNAGLPPRR